ncbi:unnamed protein product [Withania somnifera]
MLLVRCLKILKIFFSNFHYLFKWCYIKSFFKTCNKDLDFVHIFIQILKKKNMTKNLNHVQLAKEGGVDVIETYQAGMYMILRIGPFVAAEWNFGGLPVWLHYVPGTTFRTDSEPLKHHMQKFMTYAVNLMKKERLFASQGRPIISSGGKRYALWAAKMALYLNAVVPWIMCQQYDAPDPVIDTCNSFYCDQFKRINPSKPKIWTENWPEWFKTVGARDPHRPAEDVLILCLVFSKKEEYHGGTNFGRTEGGSFITTSYDYDAPIDEYARFPKWGHLKELHEVIKLCEHALLNNDPTLLSLDPLQEADVYKDASGACAAFLANMHDKNDKVVLFRNVSYHLPAWSVSILPDCKNVVFNTAKVGYQTSVVNMAPLDLHPTWEVFKEKAGVWGVADFTKSGFVDHINTTKDTTDYLWYRTRLEEFLRNSGTAMLLVESKGPRYPCLHQSKTSSQCIWKWDGATFQVWSSYCFKAGKNEIALLSMTVGLQTAGSFYEWIGAGPTSVKVEGFKSGTLDLSACTWTNKSNLNSKMCAPTSAVADAPPGNEPALDMIQMGKGMACSKYEKCVTQCDYRGKFNPDKCVTGCGEATQRWYHVPRSWFKPSGNILIIFEETGGDPSQVRFSMRKVSGACGHLSENHPSFDVENMQGRESVNDKNRATLRLKCPTNTNISAVNFASFGNPTGTCGSYMQGDCHDPNSASLVEKKCPVQTYTQLCPSTVKKHAVEVNCS